MVAEVTLVVFAEGANCMLAADALLYLSTIRVLSLSAELRSSDYAQNSMLIL